MSPASLAANWDLVLLVPSIPVQLPAAMKMSSHLLLFFFQKSRSPLLSWHLPHAKSLLQPPEAEQCSLRMAFQKHFGRLQAGPHHVPWAASHIHRYDDDYYFT